MMDFPYKRFRVQVFSRVIAIGFTTLLFIYLLYETSLYVTVVLIGIAWVFQLFSIIHFVERTNRDLTRFLHSIKYSDFSQTFSTVGLSESFQTLHDAFSDVMMAFHEARSEKEANYRYLQTVVQHIGVGLICFDKSGRVELINNAAKRLLRVPHLKNINFLKQTSRSLYETLPELKSGDKALVKVETGDEVLQLAVYATHFKLQEREVVLVSLQNIGGELEEKEMEAWQNLTRVLAHEIMNSITPIASLAGTVNDLLDETPLEEQTLEDIHGAVKTIEKRSEGLLHFVNAYRDLTRIPRPEFQLCSVKTLFLELEQLLRPRLNESEVEWYTKVEPETLELIADAELIEQVLINLAKNALDATAGRALARVEMQARLDDRGKVVIQVIDNGPGIPSETLGKVFVPFFTTKKTGSGIGLSFSRQIMRMHRGTLTVSSQPERKTVFTLRF